MKCLYLIRHGNTEANDKHLYCGSTDLPLSDSGIRQLMELHYELPERCLFVTSGMKRTEQTLCCLAGNVPHKRDVRFREMNFGIFEMHCYEQLKDVPEYQRWISGDNEINIPPGGESGIQVQKRVLEGLQEMLEEDEDIVLITHGGVIAIIMQYLFPDENKNRYEWQPGPGCGYLIEKDRYEPLSEYTFR